MEMVHVNWFTQIGATTVSALTLALLLTMEHPKGVSQNVLIAGVTHTNFIISKNMNMQMDTGDAINRTINKSLAHETH